MTLIRILISSLKSKVYQATCGNRAIIAVTSLSFALSQTPTNAATARPRIQSSCIVCGLFAYLLSFHWYHMWCHRGMARLSYVGGYISRWFTHIGPGSVIRIR